jgi:hypothetical protein
MIDELAELLMNGWLRDEAIHRLGNIKRHVE